MFISVKIESLRYCCLTPMFVKYDFPFVKPSKRDVTSIDFRDQSFFYRRSKGGEGCYEDVWGNEGGIKSR